MIDQLMILAESGAGASEGIPAPFIGIGAFAILMTMLAITWRTGGAHHRSLDKKHDADTDSDTDR